MSRRAAWRAVLGPASLTLALAACQAPAPAGVGLAPATAAAGAAALPVTPAAIHATAPPALGGPPAAAPAGPLPAGQPVVPMGVRPRPWSPPGAGPAAPAVATGAGTASGDAAGLASGPAGSGAAPAVGAGGSPASAGSSAPTTPADLAPPPPPAVTGAWLVRFAPDADVDGVLAAMATEGYRARGRLTLGGAELVRLDPPAGRDAAAVRAALAARPGVASVTPEALRHRQDFDFTKPDPLLGKQYAHRADRGNTVGAWGLVPVVQQGTTAIAILDSGLDTAHPEFAGRVLAPRNFTPTGGPEDVSDPDGHGTHVAGIAAAAGDNDYGGAGVAWGVKILPVKVLDANGGADFDIVAGFLHAVRYRGVPDDGTRVRVINMSLGTATGAISTLWTDAVAEARAAGIVVVAAAGNNGAATVEQPANTPGVVAVGSSNSYLFWEDVSPFSNHGDRLDLVAPGEDIVSTLPRFGSQLGVEFGPSSGTSMASPYVAGVAALVMARYDSTNFRVNAAFAELVRQRLLLATTDMGAPGRDPWSGEGRLDAGRAVTPATIDATP